jgi:putative pyruvate formate lyase activating enzyme
VVPQILSAVQIAVDAGLAVPLVYNSGGYDSIDTLKLLEGVVDIYMPDFKFWDPEVAKNACDAEDYPQIAQQALKEMHRQVGDLVTDEAGIAQRGILLRHLVLPQGLAGTRSVMRFIAREISTNTYVNIMPQYRPCGQAAEIKELSHHLSQKDFETALEEAIGEGIERLDSRRRRFALW